MKIGGLQKFSLLDYPEHLSAIVFTQGCNFRCQFCYNPMLVTPLGAQSQTLNSSAEPADDEAKEVGRPVSEDDLFVFLKMRVKKLDAVVITGGEPTLHSDLPDFARKVKELGFKVKLDTNGTNPDMLEDLISQNLIDYIAMDLKAPLDKYDQVAGVQPDLEKIQKSIKIIRRSGLPYEFRTTVVPGLIGAEDIKAMGRLLKNADKWFLQRFKSDTRLVNPSFENASPYTAKDLEDMKRTAEHFVEFCGLR